MVFIFIIAAILGLFLVFAIIKKIIKWMIILTTLIIMTLVGGFLFLSGDGSMTEEYLPDNVQNEINNVRDNTNQKIQNKANSVKEAATQKVNDATEKAVKTVEQGVKNAIENGTQEAKEQLQNTLSGDKTSDDASNNGNATEEPSTDAPSE